MCSSTGMGRWDRLGTDGGSSYGAEDAKRGDSDVEVTDGEAHIGRKFWENKFNER